MLLFDLNLSLGCGRVKHLVHHADASRESGSVTLSGFSGFAAMCNLDYNAQGQSGYYRNQNQFGQCALIRR